MVGPRDEAASEGRKSFISKKTKERLREKKGSFVLW